MTFEGGRYGKARGRASSMSPVASPQLSGIRSHLLARRVGILIFVVSTLFGSRAVVRVARRPGAGLDPETMPGRWVDAQGPGWIAEGLPGDDAGSPKEIGAAVDAGTPAEGPTALDGGGDDAAADVAGGDRRVLPAGEPPDDAGADAGSRAPVPTDLGSRRRHGRPRPGRSPDRGQQPGADRRDRAGRHPEDRARGPQGDAWRHRPRAHHARPGRGAGPPRA